MKKLILSIGLLFIGLSLFAQNECKCFTKTAKTYEIIGDITYEEGNNKYYVGIKDSTLYITQIEFKGDVVAMIIAQTIPVENVCLTFNDPLTSRSKTIDKIDYTEVTLGTEFKDKRKLGNYHTAYCHMPTPSSGSNERPKLKIVGRFADKEKVTKLIEKLKTLQGS